MTKGYANTGSSALQAHEDSTPRLQVVSGRGGTSKVARPFLFDRDLAVAEVLDAPQGLEVASSGGERAAALLVASAGIALLFVLSFCNFV